MTPGSAPGSLRRWLDLLRGRAATARAHSDEPATPTDERMMARALELAHAAAEAGETPVGAVVYETASGDILAEAHNLREGPNDPAGHAELIAIRAAAAKLGDWRLNACTLVVTLEPCAMCAGLIVNARVGRLVYGARDPKAGAVESLYRLCQDARLNHRITPIAGVMEDQCGVVLRAFFRERRAAKKHRRDGGE
ncbi:MAG: nucleoside deaminase [Phycisphaeraceae bacterium]|nr:MAG: nucleoside deaminase [Phycisphaeraceae bacterium]